MEAKNLTRPMLVEGATKGTYEILNRSYPCYQRGTFRDSTQDDIKLTLLRYRLHGIE